jgi:hypothetical protein
MVSMFLWVLVSGGGGSGGGSSVQLVFFSLALGIIIIIF